MEGLTKPAITRLARRAGVKCMADDCTDALRALMAMKLDDIIRSAMIINGQKNTKTLMPEDIYCSLEIGGINMAKTSEC